MLIGTTADFSQNDPRWQNDLLGFSTWEKFGPFGCLVTAFANVAQAQGTDIDPLGMNAALKTHGLFVRDRYGEVADIAGFPALSACAAHSHFVEQKNWPGSVVAPAAYFDVRASVDTELIVWIPYPPEKSNTPDHFCRVIGLNETSSDVEIVDSFTGKRVWLSSIAAPLGKSPFQIIWAAGKYQRV